MNRHPNQHPLEFWGRALLNAAAWQRQFEWLMQMMPMAGPFAGPSPQVRNGEPGLPLNQAPSDQLSETLTPSGDLLANWLKLYGWVPREQFEALQARVDTLEKRCLRQREIIARLRRAQGLDTRVFFDGFSQLFTRQGKEFGRLMDTLRQVADSQPMLENNTENGEEDNQL